jgi:uncharacterized protein (TIGR02058 family)
MAQQRVILELGAGTALHGGNYTKAAVRAVQDCIYHSSLSFLGRLGIEAAAMQVRVTVGVQRPELVDKAAVEAVLPHGQVTVDVVKGGLDVPDPEANDLAVIASAAVDVRIDTSAAQR